MKNVSKIWLDNITNKFKNTNERIKSNIQNSLTKQHLKVVIEIILASRNAAVLLRKEFSIATEGLSSQHNGIRLSPMSNKFPSFYFITHFVLELKIKKKKLQRKREVVDKTEYYLIKLIYLIKTVLKRRYFFVSECLSKTSF